MLLLFNLYQQRPRLNTYVSPNLIKAIWLFPPADVAAIIAERFWPPERSMLSQ